MGSKHTCSEAISGASEKYEKHFFRWYWELARERQIQVKSANTGKEGQDEPKMTSQAVAPVFCTGDIFLWREATRYFESSITQRIQRNHSGASVHRPVTQTWWPPTYLVLVFQSLREGWKRDLWRSPWEKSILRMKEEDGEGDSAVREDMKLWRTENFWNSVAKSKH